MKKFLSMVLALLLIFSLCGCGGGKEYVIKDSKLKKKDRP